MSEHKCDRCGTPTNKTKEIFSKKTGKQYKVYECVAGCRNGKWSYTFFPPKETQKVISDSGDSSGLAPILKAIDYKLGFIVDYIQTSKKDPLDSINVESDPQ